MLKIKILSIGKIKSSFLNDAIAEYSKRLSSQIKFEWILANDLSHLKILLQDEKYICLDQNGSMLDSLDFSKLLYDYLTKYNSRLSFVIGGAEGLSPDILNGSIKNLSLSKLTFTSQMTRVILIEQIYRASELQKGSNYHK